MIGDLVVEAGGLRLGQPKQGIGQIAQVDRVLPGTSTGSGRSSATPPLSSPSSRIRSAAMGVRRSCAAPAIAGARGHGIFHARQQPIEGHGQVADLVLLLGTRSRRPRSCGLMASASWVRSADGGQGPARQPPATDQ